MLEHSKLVKHIIIKIHSLLPPQPDQTSKRLWDPDNSSLSYGCCFGVKRKFFSKIVLTEARKRSNAPDTAFRGERTHGESY